MREIKFRAWNGKEILYGILPWNDNAVLRIFSAHEIVPATAVMQYTGLKDDNGVDIYEGDIFKTNHRNLRVVKWQSGRQGIGFNIGESSQNSRIVIGNIYENPDLLTKA